MTKGHMGVRSFLRPALFTNNIIAKAEFRHQRYVLENSRSGWGWILLATVMLLPGILISFVMFGLAASGNSVAVLLDIPQDRVSFATILLAILQDRTPASLSLLSMIVMNIALYFVVILVTVGLAANSITREKLKRTWDVLLLTNVDADRLVLGKWWASLRAMMGDHLMLAILRIGAVNLVVSEVHQTLAQPPLSIPSGLFYALAMSLFVLVFTALDAGFTVALGIALPLSTLQRPVTVALVISVRFIAMIYNFAFAIILCGMLIWNQQPLLAASVTLLIGCRAQLGRHPCSAIHCHPW
jgi:ABC-type transport system involved in multi-copper enzyme maturation permease subunit